jgi:ribosome-binding protein aMBF1 (putative translation factor)
MYCRICGDETATAYRDRSRMVLCPSCHEDTPAKVGRAEFELDYWEGQAETVPPGIRREFWEDYRASRYSSVADYRTATSSH